MKTAAGRAPQYIFPLCDQTKIRAEAFQGGLLTHGCISTCKTCCAGRSKGSAAPGARSLQRGAEHHQQKQMCPVVGTAPWYQAQSSWAHGGTLALHNVSSCTPGEAAALQGRMLTGLGSLR